MGFMGSRPTQTKQIRQTQSAFTIHAKINLKIICNAMGKNPFVQTCRDPAASGHQTAWDRSGIPPGTLSRCRGWRAGPGLIAASLPCPSPLPAVQRQLRVSTDDN
jgi:hypothetical protein